MSASINIIQNNALAAFSKNAPSNVLQAIKGASAKTGVDFAYLVQQAKAESSFKADAEAKTSSATGLYQFIESTWLNVVDRYGSKHGISSEGKSREEILAMRKDPKTSSVMAAEFASENERFLEANWAKGNKEIGSTELYFAHFLGAGKAASFLQARDENRLQPAAILFPKAAAANRNVFYETATGRAKTLEEVYQYFDHKFLDFDEKPDALVQIADSATLQKEQIPDLPKAPRAEETDYLKNLRAAQVAVPAYLAPTYSPSTLPKIGMSTPSNINRPMINNPVELMLMSQLSVPGLNSDNRKKFF